MVYFRFRIALTVLSGMISLAGLMLLYRWDPEAFMAAANFLAELY